VTNEFLSAILNAAMVKRGFLGYHYQDTGVAASLNKLKISILARKQNKWDAYFTSVFDGTVRAGIVAAHDRDGTALPESLDSTGVLNP